MANKMDTNINTTKGADGQKSSYGDSVKSNSSYGNNPKINTVVQDTKKKVENIISKK